MNHNVYHPKLEHIWEEKDVLLKITLVLSLAQCHPVALWANLGQTHALLFFGNFLLAIIFFFSF